MTRSQVNLLAKACPVAAGPRRHHQACIFQTQLDARELGSIVNMKVAIDMLPETMPAISIKWPETVMDTHKDGIDTIMSLKRLMAPSLGVLSLVVNTSPFFSSVLRAS